MRIIFGRIWFVWYGLIFILLFLAFYPFFYLLLSPKDGYKLADRFRKIWGKIVTYSTFMFPEIIYETPLSPNKQFIYCPNHISYLDIVLTGSFLPSFNFFMAKMELSKLPLFKIWFRTLDVPVKRENLRSAHSAFFEAAKKLDNGANLIIFPEGKIPNDTPKIHYPLKPGAFKLAIEKGLPIVPITILDNLNRLDVERYVCFPGKMRMIVHAPIETKDLSIDDAKSLSDQVYSIIHSELIKHNII